MGDKIFLAPRLTGARFEDHTLPVSILEDFTALEELIIDVAKGIYLVENSNRKRVPKGFSDGIYLKLTDIEEGSAIPKFAISSLVILNTALPLEDIDNFFYFEKAKDKIISIIETVNKGEFINEDNQKYLYHFNKIGKNLLDDEAIDFGYDIETKTESSAILNKTTRKKILLSREQKEEYSDNIKLFALVPSINQIQNKFSIESDDGIIECQLKDEILNTVLNAVSEYKKKTFISLSGTGIFNWNDKLVRIEDIESIDILDIYDVSLRLSELSKLENNWLNGQGKALNRQKLRAFGDIFNSYYNSKLSLPAIFPTIDGNIQLEWKNGNNNVTLEVNIDSLVSNLYYYNDSDDGDENEAIMALSSKGDWDILNSLIENKI